VREYRNVYKKIRNVYKNVASFTKKSQFAKSTVHKMQHYPALLY